MNVRKQLDMFVNWPVGHALIITFLSIYCCKFPIWPEMTPVVVISDGLLSLTAVSGIPLWALVPNYSVIDWLQSILLPEFYLTKYLPDNLSKHKTLTEVLVENSDIYMCLVLFMMLCMLSLFPDVSIRDYRVISHAILNNTSIIYGEQSASSNMYIIKDFPNQEVSHWVKQPNKWITK